ncbi:MAG: alpha/beta hydrolase, partial [Lachnospiraceae bacterium]
MKIREGYIPYLGYQTYYRIVGESRGGTKPLLLLHGGPGSTHNYNE